MSKKSKRRQRSGSNERTASQPTAAPRVLFGVGDADYGYSEGKILRLVQRLKQQSGAHVTALAHDAETLQAAKQRNLSAGLVNLESPGVTVEERLRATDEMIRETADIDIPGSSLPLWKVLAMDDFLSSLQLFGARPRDCLDADLIVTPLMAIDNNTRASCGLYTWMVSEARRKGIPCIALEVSPLGNKNTLSQLPADHYAVKGEWSREFLVREGLARPEQVSVLRWEEAYCLWPGQDEYTEAYLEHEVKAREMLNLGWNEFVILIPHHVAFLWEVRKILEVLAQVEIPATVIVRVDSRTVRRHFPEREIVMETYAREMRALRRVLIDERVGIGLLLQLADLVISPFAGTTTERASLCRKPTIICQALAQEGARGEFLHWEPRPEKIPQLIRSWHAKGWLTRTRLASIVAGLIDRKNQAAA